MLCSRNIVRDAAFATAFYILFLITMKKNPIQKKGIWLMSIGLLFIVLTVVLYLWKGIADPGSMSLGVMFLVMGAMQYFIRGKQYQMPDEMIKKINALAMAQSF